MDVISVSFLRHFTTIHNYYSFIPYILRILFPPFNSMISESKLNLFFFIFSSSCCWDFRSRWESSRCVVWLFSAWTCVGGYVLLFVLDLCIQNGILFLDTPIILHNKWIILLNEIWESIIQFFLSFFFSFIISII